MATVAEIITNVQRMFGDESGVQINEADMIRWINQGARTIVMQNESLYQLSTTASSVADQQLYSLPSDLLILRSIKYKESTTGQYFKLDGYDLAKFEELVDGWEGDTSRGVPTCFTVVDTSTSPQVVAVYPTPQVAVVDGFKITYNRMPVEVTDTTDTPDLPLIYHDILVKHCVQQAYELDEDWEAAGNKAGELDRDINLLRGREEWKAQATYPVINVCLDDL